MNGKPLSGIKVLDFTAMLPGPMCTLFLADLGADVVKIEPPVTGEAGRGRPDAPTAYFLLNNRNKRSLALNLKSPQAREVVFELAAGADILVEGFRPGAMGRLGLDYAAINAVNPRLVYCSITGYGQTGPLAHKAGHDTNYQSYAGTLGQNVIDGSRPSPGGFQIADLAGGSLSAAVGILAALFDVQRGGKGRHVDISMTDCTLALNVNPMAARLSNGGRSPVPGEDVTSGGLPCYRTYRTSDGRYLAFGALEPKFWSAFCRKVERQDLEVHGWDMGSNRAEIIAEVAAIVASRTLEAWTVLLADVDACISPVLTLDEVLEHPNTKARGMVKQVPSAAGQQNTLQISCPIAMSDFAFSVDRPPPQLGEHNNEILTGLGYSTKDIAALRAAGVTEG
jgi:alpha-methylacyl-CoA racemase